MEEGTDVERTPGTPAQIAMNDIDEFAEVTGASFPAVIILMVVLARLERSLIDRLAPKSPRERRSGTHAAGHWACCSGWLGG